MSKAAELMAVAAKVAVQEFKRDGEVAPDFLMENEFGIRTLVRWGAEFNNSKSKDQFADTMRKALHEYGAVRYAFTIEAWMVDGTKIPDGGVSAMKMARSGMSLEYHPDRTEGVIIFVEDRDTKEHLKRVYRILRPEHGNPTLAPPVDMSMANDDGEGRFSNMFGADQ